MARYYKDFDAIRKRYQFVRNEFTSVRGYKGMPLYSHNDLVGVYNTEDLTFDWYRHDEYLGYLQTGSTLMLPKETTVIGG